MDLIIQARTGSSRLPNKILYKCINNISFLEFFYLRISKSKNINRIIIATSINRKDDIIEDICIQNKWLYFRGDENNLISRFYHCCLKFNISNIIRITSDCPLVDYKMIDKIIDKFWKSKKKNNINFMDMKYYMNQEKHGFP
tara:strand:- start:214 stop:639 length:426 start_codon:yes stop_codon:yes gene_type:complete